MVDADVQEWIAEINHAVESEGWAIFEAHNTDGSVALEIQRDDEAKTWDSDETVWLHVLLRAREGSAIHRTALGVMLAHSPEQWQRMEEALGPLG